MKQSKKKKFVQRERDLLKSFNKRSDIHEPKFGLISYGHTSFRVSLHPQSVFCTMPKLKSPDASTANAGGGPGSRLHRPSIFKTSSSRINRWIQKACSPGLSKSVSVTKYHRKLLNALWCGDTGMSNIVNALEQHGGIRRNPNSAIKGLILLLRVFQFGPGGEIIKGARESSTVLVFVDTLCGVWAAKQAEVREFFANSGVIYIMFSRALIQVFNCCTTTPHPAPHQRYYC